jgi:hypothetical protein
MPPSQKETALNRVHTLFAKGGLFLVAKLVYVSV